MQVDLRKRMGALALGGWIGFLDTLAFAIAVSLRDPEDRLGGTLRILLVCVMPGMLIGFMLGAVIRELPFMRVAARRAIVLAPPIIIVGGFWELQRSRPWLLVFALLPMIGCSLYLEYRTRYGDTTDDFVQPPLRRSGASALGAVIGTCNAIFIAVVIGVQSSGDDGVVVFLLGILPALVIGYCVGAIAAMLWARPVWVRCIALVVAPVGALLVLVAPLGDTAVFAPAMIPTAVCGLVLERATRRAGDLPAARVRR
jgi:hypothetical protein